MKTKHCLWMALLLLTLCACTGGGATVAADGSTSMEAVIGALGEAFELKYGDVRVTYNPTGSGAGIQAVLDGRCDIGLSSRALKDTERGLTATVLAYDGIAVIVHPDNPVADLRTGEIAAIFTGEVADWSEIGGASGEIVRIGREAGSGTRNGFESATDTAGVCQYRQELTSSGDVVTTVAQNPNAIGYASLASVKDSVKVVAVDGVMPTEDAIRDGSYGIRRPFLLVTRSGERPSESVQKFFDFIASPEAAEIIAAAGAVAAVGQ